jgi:RHS repeat-associated protein
VRRGCVIRFLAPTMVVLLVATILQLLSVSVAPPPAEASTVTGSGGLFVPLTDRLVSSQDGIGVPKGPLTANTWYTIKADWTSGFLAPDANALQITVTVVSPTTSGIVHVSPNNASTYTALVYGSGVTGTVSNTAIVALSANATFGIEVQTSVNVIVDAQGYYRDQSDVELSGVAGGYVPLQEPTRLVDTRTTGTGLPQGPLKVNTTSTVQVTGNGGVPTTAWAAMVNFEVINHSAQDGYLVPYDDVVDPASGISLNYPGGGTAGTATAIGAVVPVNNSGYFDVQVKSSDPSATIDLVVDVVGYFRGFADDTATAASVGGFVPAATRVANAISVPAGTTGHIPVAGVAGVPAAGSGIQAVAANVDVQGTGDGSLVIGPDSSPLPAESAINFIAGSYIRSNFVTVALGSDGGVSIQNDGTTAITVTIDVEGWYTSPATIVRGGQSSTMRSVTLQASGDGLAADQDRVTYKYRLGTQGAFQFIPDGSTGQLKDGDGDAVSQPSMLSAGAFAPWTWDVAATVVAAGGSTAAVTVVQVEACYGNDAGTQWCPAPWNIMVTPSSTSEATTSIGPGVLSLGSGDYTVSATDATLTTSLGEISIGRTLDTLHPTGEDTTATGIFGPGWRADLAGPDAGEGGLTAVDHHTDGYLVFTDDAGTPTVFEATSPTTTFPISFTAIGDDASDGITLTMDSASKITWVDPDQTKTIWTYSNSVWQAIVQQSGANPASTTSKYFYNSAGLVTRILGPSPAGVTCTDANADTTPGCRSLVLNYTDAAHICGTTQIRLCSVDASLPQTAGAAHKVTVEQYGYSTAGQLTSSFDPRISPNLVTSYDYDGDHRLTALTPPWDNPWTFAYDGQRLSTITRTVPVTDPATGNATDQPAVTTVVYGVPLTGTGMPDVSAGTAKTWDEVNDLPDPNLKGTAVFAPDHQPAATDPDHVGTADWPYATIHYLDTNGRGVNTATYGAGQWLIDTTQFDNNGNDVWDLDAGNRAQALNPLAGTTDAFVAGKASSSARADLLAATTVYNPLDPSEVTDTYGPTHLVTLSTGAVIHARTHVATTYDQNAPGATNPATGAPYRLPTKVVTAPFNVSTGTDAAYPDRGTTVAGYAAVGIMSGYTGWSLGLPTTSTVQMGASPSSSDLTTTTVYDADGRVVQTRLPGDYGGNTPRATNTSYYTVTGTGTCVQPEFAGLVCQTSPGAQPSTGAALPTVTYSYEQWGNVLTQTSRYVNATTTTKRTTNAYDAAGRLRASQTTVAPEPTDDTGLPAVTTTYSTLNGQVATVSTSSSAGSRNLVTTYDDAGAVSSYTDSTGNVTKTGYDIDGRPVRQSDSKGTVTLGYDGSDEHRGLVTSEDIGTSSDSTFTAAYDASGDLATQTYPGGLVAKRSYDNAGDPTELTYVKVGATLLGFTQAFGDAYTGGDHIVAQASAVDGQDYSSQEFTDDAAGRLVTVADTYNGSCTTRTYDLDIRSNRFLLTDFPAAADGACSESTSATGVYSEYDDADRLTDDIDVADGDFRIYGYDVLGRTSTLPAADAVGIGSYHAATGDLALSYYNNDMVASQAQGSGDDATTIAFGLDPDQNRVLTEATTTSAGTKTLTNHYDDASDETAWTSTLKIDGTTVTKRYVDGIDGNLDALVNDNGDVKLELTNIHGDIVATIDPGATSITGYQETTEFGIPRDPASAADDYGWLGAKKRSSNDLGGLTLMGVRLYNPATGRFLSVDPVPGGNANAYTYPTDPINNYDTTGATTVPVGGEVGCHCAHNGVQKLSGIEGYYTSGWTTIDPGAGVVHDLIGGITGYGTVSTVTLDKVQVRRRTERRTLYTCKHHVWEAEPITTHVYIQYRAYYSVAWVFHRRHTFGWEKVF